MKWQTYIKAGRIDFTTDLAFAVKKSSVVFLALPTPPGEDGSADLKYILEVAKDLGGDHRYIYRGGR